VHNSPKKDTETSTFDGNSPNLRKKFGKEKEEDLESEATIKKQTRKLREFFDYDTIAALYDRIEEKKNLPENRLSTWYKSKDRINMQIIPNAASV